MEPISRGQSPLDPPSSPPALPHQPTSPPARPALTRNSSSRKRLRNDSSYTNSSDPAVFSSDDPNVSIDDYVPGRKKRHVVGTWWKTEPLPLRRASLGLRKTPGSKKRGFRRNFDSGVFMGSDQTEPSSDPSLPMPLAGSDQEQGISPSEIGGCDLKERSASSDGASDLDSTLGQELPISDYLPQSHKVAREVVNKCVEEGIQRVDLSGLELEEIPPSLIRDMELIRPYVHRTSRPEEYDYADLRPMLGLYLAGNNLTGIPGEICKLTSLSSLSLRNNSISTLPSQLRNLTQLQSLNVAANSLNYLPGYFLLGQFPKLSLIHQPNPFYGPVHPTSHKPIAHKDPTSQVVSVAYISTICFYDVGGNVLPGSNPPPSQVRTNRQPRPTICPPSSAANVPSLLEITLRAYANDKRDSALGFHDLDDLPPSVHRGLKQVDNIRRAGENTCDACGTGYVLPRAEWLEWWPFLGAGFNTYLFQVCSWACAQKGTQWWNFPNVLVDCGWMIAEEEDDSGVREDC